MTSKIFRWSDKDRLDELSKQLQSEFYFSFHELESVREEYEEAVDSFYSRYADMMNIYEDKDSFLYEYEGDELANRLEIFNAITPLSEDQSLEKWYQDNLSNLEYLYDQDKEDFDDGYYKNEEQVKELKTKYATIERSVYEILAWINEFQKNDYHIITIDSSRKSVSTYVTLSATDFERFETDYSGDADFSYFDDLSKEELQEELSSGQFQVRFSDHEVGGYSSEDGYSMIDYSKDNVKFDI